MKFIPTLLFFFISSISIAQYECSTKDPSNYKYFGKDQLQNEIQRIKFGIRSDVRVFMMAINIIRSDNGKEGISKQEVLDALEIVNNEYEKINIRFDICGEVNYIDDSDYVKFNISSNSSIVKKYNLPNIINVYIFPQLLVGLDKLICGQGSFPDSNNFERKLFLAKNCIDNKSTFIHELGHFFGVLHTHSTSRGKEYVARTNCSFAGDGFCDTPADPKLSNKKVSQCIYIGDEKDALGVKYKPDVYNYMSYSPKSCRIHFSNEQMARISLVSKIQNNYIYKECNQPDITIRSLESNNIELKYFKDIDIKLVINNLVKEVNDSVLLKISYSTLKNGFSNIFYSKKVFLGNGENEIIKTITIPFNSQLLNSNYINVWIDAEENIEELNEINNRLRLTINLNEILQKKSFLFPNPISDELTFIMDNNLKGNVKLLMFSTDGKMIREYKFEKFYKYQLFKIDNIDLKKGNYFIKVIYNSKNTESFKFTKI